MISSDTCETVALTKASSKGHVECVNLLLKKGASVNLLDEVSAVSHQVLSF